MSPFNSGRTKTLILLGGIVCAIAIGTCLWQPVWLFQRRDFRTGNEIISRVESFRQSHGYLPGSLKDIGVTDPDLRVFYCRAGDNEYIVWFGTTLGESETYDSRTKKWDGINAACE